jgi:hypothetical protein
MCCEEETGTLFFTLRQMSRDSAAFDFVLSSGALKTLCAILGAVHDPMALMIAPAVFRFWANLASYQVNRHDVHDNGISAQRVHVCSHCYIGARFRSSS